MPEHTEEEQRKNKPAGLLGTLRSRLPKPPPPSSPAVRRGAERRKAAIERGEEGRKAAIERGKKAREKAKKKK